MPRAVRIALWGLLVIVPAGLVLFPLPYYAVGPGEAREVAPLIRFDELQRFDSGGHLVMTTVRRYQLTPLTALDVWLDDAWSAVPERELYPAGVDREEEEAVALVQMEQSHMVAAWVVLEELVGYPDEHGAGALIASTEPGCAASGRLYPGEVITAIDGQAIASLAEAREALDAVEPGDAATLELRSGDDRREAEVRKRPCGHDQEPLFGVQLLESFPIDVEMEGADVGGPSGGLMFALGFYDLLTPGDLTGGATIAGTGQIFVDGTVGPIGGIADKIVAAEDAGASLFLSPRENLEELRGIDTGDMRVVGVGSFDEAIDALLEAGGTDEGAPVPLAT